MDAAVQCAELLRPDVSMGIRFSSSVSLGAAIEEMLLPAAEAETGSIASVMQRHSMTLKSLFFI